ncbi:MAG: hypothetical protein ACE5HN_07205 [Nitrospiria bacterium]
MNRSMVFVLLLTLFFLGLRSVGKPADSEGSVESSKECIGCHQNITPVIVAVVGEQA